VFRTSDGLIVLDQLVDENCGVVEAEVRDAIDRLARREPDKLIYVDSRRFLGRFSSGVLKGNSVGSSHGGWCDGRRCQRVGGAAIAGCSCWQDESRRLLHNGRNAASLSLSQSRSRRLLPQARSSGPIDIVGAGDAATSGMSQRSLERASWKQPLLAISLPRSPFSSLGRRETATPEQVDSVGSKIPHVTL